MLIKRTFKRLQHKLMLAFLVLSITPLSLLAVFFLQSHSDDLQTQSTTHLGFLRDHKKEKIIQYFDARHLEAKSFSRSELATASGGRFYGLVAAFHQLGKTKEEAKTLARKHFSPSISTKNPDEHILENQRYNLLHKRYDWAFKEYLKDSDFSDILLVDIDGTVVYSSKKEATFAANLLSNKWINTAVGQTFSLIKEKVKERQAQSHLNLQNTSGHDAQTSPIIFTDFNLSQEGEMQSWFAAPITQQGYLHSFALFKLPNHPLVKLLNTLPKENPNITTLLVGEDRLQRNLSKPPLSPIKSEAIDNALSGLIDVGSFMNSKVERALGAYTPVFVMGKQWALILEIPEDEAFAQIYQLEKIFVAVMLLAIFFVILGSHLLSNSITAPLLRLTWAAEQVSAGDLDQKISSTNRQDEIGRLAVSFARMQRSVREKLSLIHDQNKTLEQNISLIKQKNKALKQADRMKDDFLATTSHELRTPLHGMIGLAQAMLATTQDGPERERQQSQLQMIINSGERLSSLVDDLLDYHKMRSGKLTMSLQAVDTANVIRLVIELSSHHLGAKPVRIINQIPIDLPLVRADEQRLEQVLYNLMGNAIKYTDEGKIVISATLLDKKLRIQVVDTGQGIPCDELEYIFEPLTHSNATSYRQDAGLGLSISKHLIDIMGGHLYISSQPMVGTTLSFTLPLASEADKAKTHLSSNTHFLAPKFNPINIHLLPENPNGPLILIVDDEPVNLQVLNNYLRLEGYRVKTVENGRQAIESITLEKPALMLLDVMMPELSGYEVCAHLRERYNPAQLPIILLSALGKVQDKVRGFDAGANDYFIKPFNKHELSSRIRAYINASLTEQARENNQALKEEIHQKEETESGLRTLQNALFNMLEMAPQAIVAITNKGEITFANLASASFFQRTQVALSYKLLSDFFPEKWPTPDLLEAFYRGEIKEIPFKIAGKTRLTHIEVKTLPQSSGLQMLLIINADNKRSSERVLLLENAVDTLADFAFSGEIEKLEDLRNLGNEFTHIADKFTHKKQNKDDELRETLVKVMILTLKYWQHSTGKSKFELAEESALWRVYLDRSTLQTRTLDKYLHVETVPKSPRWRSVISTIDFVLNQCINETKDRAQLIMLRDKLKSLISYKAKPLQEKLPNTIRCDGAILLEP